MAEFPVSDEDIKALRLKLLRALAASQYPKEAIGPIAANNGLTVGDVRSVVEAYGYPDKAEMARHVIELSGGQPVARPPATPQEIVARRTDPPAPPKFEVFKRGEEIAAEPTVLGIPMDARVETLLNAARKSGKARTRRLGVKIHELVAELRGLVNSEAAEREEAEKAAAEKAKLRAEVEALERQLAAKKALLNGKPARAPKPKSAATGPIAEASPKEIRAWAAANGVECPAMGRVPAAVVTAFEAAQGAA